MLPLEQTGRFLVAHSFLYASKKHKLTASPLSVAVFAPWLPGLNEELQKRRRGPGSYSPHLKTRHCPEEPEDTFGKLSCWSDYM
jgi:hypothetical protein